MSALSSSPEAGKRWALAMPALSPDSDGDPAEPAPEPPPAPRKTTPEPRVLIVGSGGIGGVLACKLARAGRSLSLVATNEAVRAAWLEGTPSLDGARADVSHVTVLPALSAANEQYDIALVAVQSPEVESVGLLLATLLSPGGRAVCLPNGLCEDVLARGVGPERVVGAVVSWGARMPAPGAYVQSAPGGFEIGTLGGPRDAALTEVARLLALAGSVTITDNLRGARFTKLAINCAVSTLGTIGGETLGKLLVERAVRRLALDILQEAVRVAEAEGVTLEPLGHLDLRWLVPERSRRTGVLSDAAKHGAMLALGARYRKMRSSMLSAIERGRPPSVDFLNGEIARRGAARGVPTPVNEAARRVVWDIAEGRVKPGPEALARVRALAGGRGHGPAE